MIIELHTKLFVCFLIVNPMYPLFSEPSHILEPPLNVSRHRLAPHQAPGLYSPMHSLSILIFLNNKAIMLLASLHQSFSNLLCKF